MEDALLRGLKRLSFRARLVRTLRLVQAIAFFAMSGLVAVFLVDRILFEVGLTRGSFSTPDVMAVTGAAFVAVLAAAALLASRLGAPDLRAVAIEFDRRASTDQVLATALELRSSGERTPFYGPLLRRAVETLDRLPLDRLMPLPRTPYLTLFVFAVLGGSVLFAFPGTRLYAPRADFVLDPDRGTAPLTVTATHASCGHIDAFRWDWGDGSVDESMEAAHMYRAPGRYIVTLQVSGPRGTDRRQRTVEVVPPRHPVARFKADPSKGRAPLDVRFENLSQGSDRFEWDFGDGRAAAERSPSHRYETPGEYRVRLGAISGGIRDEASATVRVLDPEGPVADFVANPTEGPAPLKVQFESRSQGAVTEYEWDVGDFYSGDEAIKKEKNPAHEYRVPGVYTVRLKVKGPRGQDEAVKERYIKVGPKGGSGGGGGGGAGKADAPAPKPPPAAPSKPGAGEGPLYGPKSERPKVELDPQSVKPIVKGDDLVEKEKSFFSPQDKNPAGKPPDQRLKEMFPYYERQAEETILREQIPADSRKFVREYFDRIRPKE